MSFAEKIAALSQRAPNLADRLETEEATKNALVLPFISALGYDIFNPAEVVPELTADVGIKRGEKVDYALCIDGVPVILMECKRCGTDLQRAQINQLFRYFTVTEARIGVLTDGLHYRFFSDLETPNRMDTRPFLELDLLDPSDRLITELAKLSRQAFDIAGMLEVAVRLKALREIKRSLEAQMSEPDEELVRFFHAKAHPGSRFVAAAKQEFTVLVRQAFREFVRDRVNDRLRSALASGEASSAEPPEGPPADAEDDGIATTLEELEGFHIVKSIVRQTIQPDRIGHRDTKSYLGILIDDNNRRPICRLWFDSKTKYIGIFDADKNETRIPLEKLDDIYLVSDQLRETAARYTEFI